MLTNLLVQQPDFGRQLHKDRRPTIAGELVIQTLLQQLDMIGSLTRSTHMEGFALIPNELFSQLVRLALQSGIELRRQQLPGARAPAPRTARRLGVPGAHRWTRKLPGACADRRALCVPARGRRPAGNPRQGV